MTDWKPKPIKFNLTLELFPCSGGLAGGLRRAGIEIDMAFDKDPDACASYEKNMGHRPVQMDVSDLLRMVESGWTPGPIKFMVCDPPCTPWSRAGKRQGRSDERDMLDETIRIIARLRPYAYLIANVPGLDDAPNWHIVQDALRPLAAEGYCVADYFQLDSADYGVPQHRIRPWWFGHLEGPCLQPPAPSHCDPMLLRTATLPGFEPLKPWVTVRQALQHLSIKDMGRPIRLRKRDSHSKQHGSVLDKPARVVGTSNLSDGNVLVDSTEDNSTHELDAPARTIRASRTDSERVMFERRRVDGSLRDHTVDEPANTIRGGRSGSDRVLLGDGTQATIDVPEMIGHKRHPTSKPDDPAWTVKSNGERGASGSTVLKANHEWPWNRPSTTVTADRRLAPPGHHGKSFLSDNRGHGPNAVVLGEKAGAILQGFPESWSFCGKTKLARWGQIGMAMPPPFAEAVGHQIKKWFDARDAESEKR